MKLTGSTQVTAQMAAPTSRPSVAFSRQCATFSYSLVGAPRNPPKISTV